MALGLDRIGATSIGSGSSNGVGGCEEGELRPRGPSGDDCIDVCAGVVDKEGQAEVMVEIGVMLNDNGVIPTFCCEGAG